MVVRRPQRAKMSPMSAGPRFRAAMKAEKPLQCVGAINAYHARLAERAGYKSIYLSGGGVAAGSLGLPDLGQELTIRRVIGRNGRTARALRTVVGAIGGRGIRVDLVDVDQVR